jgi:integrase
VLTSLAVAALRRHRAAQVPPRALVFCTARGTRLEQGNVYRRSYLPILKRAGLPHFRPYDLRHAVATFLAYLGVQPHVIAELLGHTSLPAMALTSSSGVQPHVIAELLGHASPTLTMRTYAHALPTMQEDAIGRLEGPLSPQDSVTPPDGQARPSESEVSP